MSASPRQVGAVIVAAGSSSRMGPSTSSGQASSTLRLRSGQAPSTGSGQVIDKLFVRLAGRPLLAHVLARFQESPEVDRIVLVVSEANLRRGRDLVAEHAFGKVSAVCAGGPRRQDSVRLGLDALGPCDWVLVHDGARLLVSAELIERGLKAARETGAAVPAVPVADTVKVAGEDGAVERTLDRSRLWAAQTPQVFRHDLLLRAHREVTADPSTSLRAGFTDDAAMLEALGGRVRLFPGSSLNIKVTNHEDLRLAEALLQGGGEPVSGPR